MRFIDASYSIKLSGQGLFKDEYCAGIDQKYGPRACISNGRGIDFKIYQPGSSVRSGIS